MISIGSATPHPAGWPATAQPGKTANPPATKDWREVDPRDLFAKFEHRIQSVAPMLQEDDKACVSRCR